MIRIRFHAIDAPESGQPHGKAAKAALSELIYGKAVEVEPYEQDRYDRLVARVWLDGQDINAEMIKTGNAWTYRRYADEPAYCAYESGQGSRPRPLALAPRDRSRPGNGGNASRARATSPTTRRRPSPPALRRSVGEPASAQALGLNATAMISGVNPASGRPGSVAWRYRAAE